MVLFQMLILAFWLFSLFTFYVSVKHSIFFLFLLEASSGKIVFNIVIVIIVIVNKRVLAEFKL